MFNWEVFFCLMGNFRIFVFENASSDFSKFNFLSRSSFFKIWLDIWYCFFSFSILFIYLWMFRTIILSSLSGNAINAITINSWASHTALFYLSTLWINCFLHFLLLGYELTFKWDSNCGNPWIVMFLQNCYFWFV